MTYEKQVKEALACRDKEEARVWLIREILRYQRDYRKLPNIARRQIMSNVMVCSLKMNLDLWERAVVLFEP